MDNRIGVPLPNFGCPGRICEKAPPPPLRMMRDLQSLSADKRVAPAARQIARGCCVLAFATLRGEHTNAFGIMQLANHGGRITAYGKSRRKKKGAPTEYFILCMSGINEEQDWYENGGEALDNLPPDEVDYLVRSFSTAPGSGNANNPFKATRLENAPINHHQFDLAIAHVLVHIGYSWSEARRYTLHSFKHFLPEVVDHVTPSKKAEASIIANHVGRWAGSLLAQQPQLLAIADPNRDRYIQNISKMARNYSESSQVAALRKHSQYQLDRVARAIRRAGKHLPLFGGYNWLEP